MSGERVVPGSKQPVEILDERRDLQDMLNVDGGDPNSIYRFVRDDKMNVARKRMKGYRPVTTEDEVATLVEPDDRGDGLIRVGDTILMKCSKERVRRRQDENDRFARQRLKMPKRKVKALAKKHKVKVIEDHEVEEEE